MHRFNSTIINITIIVECKIYSDFSVLGVLGATDTILVKLMSTPPFTASTGYVTMAS